MSEMESERGNFNLNEKEITMLEEQSVQIANVDADQNSSQPH